MRTIPPSSRMPASGIADYMSSIHNTDKARDQWQAVVDLAGVADVDKAKAQGLLAGK